MFHQRKTFIKTRIGSPILLFVLFPYNFSTSYTKTYPLLNITFLCNIMYKSHPLLPNFSRININNLSLLLWSLFVVLLSCKYVFWNKLFFDIFFLQKNLLASDSKMTIMAMSKKWFFRSSFYFYLIFRCCKFPTESIDGTHRFWEWRIKMMFYDLNLA